MEDQSWREKTLEKLTQILQLDKQVLSLSVFGSLANTEIEKDKWSDIDALLVVDDGALVKYYDSTDWLKSLGEIFTLQQSSGDKNQTTKIIFNDFRKIDLILVSKSRIMSVEPFWTKQEIIFSNSDKVKHLLEEKALLTNPFDVTNYDLDKLANDFWFIAFNAVVKVARNDMLIALHLTLDLYRHCLVLGMWLRDKETETNIHRIGGIRNDLIKKMDIKMGDLSKEGILLFVEKCGQEFDKLASEWLSSHTKHSPIFKGLIDRARREIENQIIK